MKYLEILNKKQQKQVGHNLDGSKFLSLPLLGVAANYIIVIIVILIISTIIIVIINTMY